MKYVYHISIDLKIKTANPYLCMSERDLRSIDVKYSVLNMSSREIHVLRLSAFPSSLLSAAKAPLGNCTYDCHLPTLFVYVARNA